MKAGGDVDADGDGEILTGPGPAQAFAAQLRGFDVTSTTRPIDRINAVVFAGARYGLEPAAGDVESDGYDELLCGAGPDPLSGSQLAAFDYDDVVLSPVPGLSQDVFGLAYGLSVGAADTGY